MTYFFEIAYFSKCPYFSKYPTYFNILPTFSKEISNGVRSGGHSTPPILEMSFYRKVFLHKRPTLTCALLEIIIKKRPIFVSILNLFLWMIIMIIIKEKPYISRHLGLFIFRVITKLFLWDILWYWNSVLFSVTVLICMQFSFQFVSLLICKLSSNFLFLQFYSLGIFF